MIRFRSLFPAVCAVGSVLAAGCSVPTEGADDTEGAEAIGSEESAIIGGTTDKRDPAVVVFDMTTRGVNLGVCTASFISRRALLTAGHCVLDDGGSVIPADATYRVFLGANTRLARDSDWIPVPRENVHPHPKLDLDADDSHDMAIIDLGRDFDVHPLPISAAPLAQNVVGRSVRVIGYGQTIGGPDGKPTKGIKRVVTTKVRDFDDLFVHIGDTGQQGCHGDSGGPALLKTHGREAIIAISSFGTSERDCEEGSYYTRVDTAENLAFIRSFTRECVE
jgi:V8-like Glu-specific endopeptidase